MVDHSSPFLEVLRDIAGRSLQGLELELQELELELRELELPLLAEIDDANNISNPVITTGSAGA